VPFGTTPLYEISKRSIKDGLYSRFGHRLILLFKRKNTPLKRSYIFYHINNFATLNVRKSLSKLYIFKILTVTYQDISYICQNIFSNKVRSLVLFLAYFQILS